MLASYRGIGFSYSRCLELRLSYVYKSGCWGEKNISMLCSGLRLTEERGLFAPQRLAGKRKNSRRFDV
jgi:hypothetical protein